MGLVNTEQTVAIIDAVGEAINNAQPEPIPVTPDVNYWALGLIALVPIIAGGVLAFFKTKKKKKEKDKYK